MIESIRSKFLFISVILILQHSISALHEENHLRKCCALDEAINEERFENGTNKLSCKKFRETPWRTKHFVTNLTHLDEEFFKTCTNDEECVDYQIKGKGTEFFVKYICGKGLLEPMETSKMKVLPKCCYLGYSYDSYYGACRMDEENLEKLKIENSLIQSNLLKECKGVITDHTLNNIEEIFLKKYTTEIEWGDTTYKWGSYCVDSKYGSEGKYILKLCEKNFDKCRTSADNNDNYQCIRKCCPFGQSTFLSHRKCETDHTLEIQGFNFHNNSRFQISSPDKIAFIHGITCSKYKADMIAYDITLDRAGVLKFHLVNENRDLYVSATEDNYCFERITRGKNNSYLDSVFLCTLDQSFQRLKLKIYSIILCISAIFLIITFIGYSVLPDMQNLHGRTLMVHCFCLIIASSLLSFMQWNNSEVSRIEKQACTALGYLLLFWFLAAFTWLNVMCFDIWWTFGSMRVNGVGQRESERKKFLLYNLYGWSFPLFVTIVAFCVQQYEFLPTNWTPDIGIYACFFSITTGHFETYALFYLTPVALLTLFDIVLFARTTYYCHKVKSEISKIKDTSRNRNEKKKLFRADTERLSIIFKLFIIMGVSWIFEIISAFFPLKAGLTIEIIEIIFDSYNSAQGVIIFCVFMLKKKVWKNFKKKIWVDKKPKLSSQATTNTSLHSSLQNFHLKNINN